MEGGRRGEEKRGRGNGAKKSEGLCAKEAGKRKEEKRKRKRGEKEQKQSYICVYLDLYDS